MPLTPHDPSLLQPRQPCESAMAWWVLLFGGLLGTSGCTTPQSPGQLLRETFSNGTEQWRTTDPQSWRLTALEGNPAFELHGDSKSYQPPVRSPHSMALYEGSSFQSFELHARVRTTHEAYDHRDLCFIFGYQDPSHFYYVHLGQKTDPHANQVFIVNGAPRRKISTKTSRGTPWQEDTWHQVKIVRCVSSGNISVFFDDMTTATMTAQDTTFGRGLIGIGSFDDTGIWDDITVTPLVETSGPNEG